MVWTRIVPGAALVLAVVAALIRSGDTVVAAHWSFAVWLAGAGLVGAALLWWGTGGPDPRPGRTRAVLRWAGAAMGVALAGITFWLAPYRVQVADMAVIESPPGVTVVSDASSIRLTPADPPEATGVVFIPGALVDPRAYVPILTPLAQAGHPVHIAKPPLGIAFLAPDVIGRASAASPGVEHWVVAGHSLGGAVGSGQAADGEAAGLILLASYPIGDLSGTDLPVLSVSGSNDGLTTAEDVEASRANLPGDSEFVVIEGGVHAFFGDYGDQAGDGVAQITREQAQAETVGAMMEFLGTRAAA